MIKRTLTTMGLAALTVGMMTTAAGAQSSTTTYNAQLDSLNDSGSTAEATIEVDEATNQATVTINGSGFVAAPHAQHIHGFDEGSTCPTGDELDEDGDGFTSTPEAQPAYGPIEVSLTTEGDTSPDSALAVERFPTYESSYNRTFDIPADVADNLGNYHIVIHGVDVNDNGEYDMDGAGPSPLDESLPFEATMPAACGTLAASASGGVDTGAGGTANAGSDAPLGLAAFGAVAIGGLAYGVRRRSIEG